LRGGRCFQLTEDHTLVAEQLKAGVVREEDAAESRFAGVLTRAIGTDRSVKVDTLVVDVLPGDAFVLCSDGLHRYAGVADLLRLASGDGELSVTKLVDHANACGGVDNISVILLACRAAVVPAAQPTGSGAGPRIDAICALPLFRDLSYREQVSVLSIAQPRSYERGATIVRQGEVGTEMFVVIEGELVVERDGVTIANLGRGGHFGEMSFVEDAPRSATVRALTRTEVLSIGQAEVSGLMRADQALAVKLLWCFVQALSKRLRAASVEIIELQSVSSVEPPRVPPPFRAENARTVLGHPPGPSKR
jgi:CRP-like cAMP-binding protein